MGCGEVIQVILLSNQQEIISQLCLYIPEIYYLLKNANHVSSSWTVALTDTVMRSSELYDYLIVCG